MTTAQITRPGRQSLNGLSDYIEEKHIKSATFILYSGGATIRTHIKHLMAENADVTILLQHPDMCVNPIDRDKVMASLRSIRNRHDGQPNPNLHVWLYKVRGSLRAVALDDRFLAVSWFTYVNSEDTDDRISDTLPNPQVITYAPSSEYNHLKTMFDGVLEDLKRTAVPFDDYVFPDHPAIRRRSESNRTCRKCPTGSPTSARPSSPKSTCWRSSITRSISVRASPTSTDRAT
ncbi:MAG: hypothetical protein U0521_11750 [Anaerolineae bacterium]